MAGASPGWYDAFLRRRSIPRGDAWLRPFRKEIDVLRNRYLLLASLFALGLALLGSLSSPAGEAVSTEKIDQLIEQMGSGTFAEREKATKELDAIGVPALEALRKAAKSDDAEVKRRAEELVKKIEKQAESAKVLAAKRIHLVYKDTPVPEAVADFRKKSGYNFHLHDPQGKLKERTIGLDTGETTFWHALELFCDKAGLTEATLQEIMMPPPPVGVPGGALAPAVQPPPAPVAPARFPAPMLMPGAMPMMPGAPEQILLKDGKAKKLPTDDRSAIRVRALPGGGRFGPVPAGEILLTLEATPEPRLQWQGLQSVRIDKALDDQDQNLTQITPQVPAGPPGIGNIGGAPGFAPPVMRPMMAPPVAMWGGLHQQVHVQLKKGEKAAKSLKELAGVISAQVLTEATPMVTADNLAKAAGKTFKGNHGGSLKILAVKTDEQKQTTIQFEFEQPPNAIAAMAPLQAVPAGAPPIPPGAPPLPPPPAPAAPAPPAPAAKAPAVKPQVVQFQVQIQGGIAVAPGGGFVAPMFMGPMMGLSVQDDKGNTLPVQMGPQQFRAMQLPGGGNVVTATYTLICRPGKDQKEPAKLVYLGRKRMAIDIPFTLKDVPLP
jgi:hypothetical protein